MWVLPNELLAFSPPCMHTIFATNTSMWHHQMGWATSPLCLWRDPYSAILSLILPQTIPASFVLISRIMVAISHGRYTPAIFTDSWWKRAHMLNIKSTMATCHSSIISGGNLIITDFYICSNCLRASTVDLWALNVLASSYCISFHPLEFLSEEK